MRIVITGSGNTATVLGHKMLEAGHEILQVISRKEEHAARLAAALRCGHSTHWTEIRQDADFYLVALSDGALEEFGRSCLLPGKLVAHTAGAVAMDVLRGVSEHYGVFYPLQSLRKEIRPFPEVPILVDARERADRERLNALARTISGQVSEADDARRLRLHLGAILVNNFTNYLYTLTGDYCEREGVDFKLLLPLIRETGDRLLVNAPRDVQTGPAVRGDQVTIQTHLSLLANYLDAKDLYGLFTKQIEAYYRKS